MDQIRTIGIVYVHGDPVDYLDRDQMARWNTPWHDTLVCDGRRICNATDLALGGAAGIEPGSYG